MLNSVVMNQSAGLRLNNAQTFVNEFGKNWFVHGSFHVDVGPSRRVQMTQHTHEVSIGQHVTNHVRLPYVPHPNFISIQ